MGGGLGRTNKLITPVAKCMKNANPPLKEILRFGYTHSHDIPFIKIQRSITVVRGEIENPNHSCISAS